jgi:hypothetical protein
MVYLMIMKVAQMIMYNGFEKMQNEAVTVSYEVLYLALKQTKQNHEKPHDSQSSLLAPKWSVIHTGNLEKINHPV